MTSVKILVVEDESITAKDIQETLKGYGYDVPAVALSGEEAIEKTEQLQPDLVLMDIMLKGDVDGIGAAEQIHRRFDIPVVYLTAYANNKIIKRAKITEPFGYIIKPFEERELHTNIEMALYKHKTEEALRKSEEKYKNLVETTDTGYHIVDGEGKVIDANDEYVRLTGCGNLDEILGRNVLEWTAEHDIERNKKEIEKCYKKGFTRGLEIDYVDKQGNITPVEINATVIDSKDERQIMALIRDITERKKAEEALRESEEKFRELFENISSGAAVYEARGNGKDFIFKNFNKAGERIENIKREKLIGKSVVEVFPKIKEFGFFDVLKRVWKTGKSEHYPISIYKDERIASWRENYVYKLPSGEIVAAYDDITERKKAEEQLIEYQGRLKSLASQLTVAEEREKQRIAMWLHDRLSQSLVSSKLRLETADASADSAEVAKVLKETCEMLGEAIEEVRALTFELSSPILHELGFETAVKDWLSEQIQQKHSIETEFEDDGKSKVMDDDIRTVLFRDVRELLMNVVKHSQAGKVKVSIRKADKHITVSVEDDGCGFDLEKINGTATGKAGFGLFSIQERLKELGGHLDIKSRRGKGTFVTLSAPLKQ